ncbi:MAG: rod shape-determining protein RodA [Lachnospira sp.]|nr:rod shape-determining protein RodA [Lachnospira sp.]
MTNYVIIFAPAILIAAIVTAIYGIIVVNSADSGQTLKQCIGLVLAVVVMITVSLFDYSWVLKFYWLMYFVNIVLLVAVQLVGDDGKGAKRWVELAGIRFQPSELTKIILILFTAKLIFMYKDKINNWKFLTVLGILLVIPVALVLAQPDLSTSLLIIMVLLTIIFCGGLSYKIIGAAILIVVPLAVGAILYVSNPNQVLLKDYQRDRIMAFLNPEENDAGVYQQEKSVQAIGSGQLTGKGLNNEDSSSLVNAGYVPEAHTDFIFAVIGEELGFVGTTLAVVLLMWIVFECVIAATKAKDFAGRLICCGVAAYIGFQSFINIGVVTQLLPNTGIPLPFFSYGLTSLVAVFIAVGFVINVSLQRNIQRNDEMFAEDFRG